MTTVAAFATAAVGSTAAVAAMSTTAASPSTPPPPPPLDVCSNTFLYRLGNSLYVPLTSRCNSRTLPQTRGENFALPLSVVAALRRVRSVEEFQQQQQQQQEVSAAQEEEERSSNEKIGGNNHSNNNDDNDDYDEFQKKLREGVLPPKLKLPPPPFAPIASLPSLTPTATASEQHQQQREPTIDQLFREIQRELAVPQQQQQHAIVESIVISGEGEPTLRLEDTIELAQRIKSLLTETMSELSTATETPASIPAIRLTTNGLVIPTSTSAAATGGGSPSVPQRLWDSGVSHVSVGLMTWNSQQYHDLMRPVVPTTATATTTPFDTVCGFVREAVSVPGMVVETTAVDRPDVDKVKTQALSESLGVKDPVRWRPYFP